MTPKSKLLLTIGTLIAVLGLTTFLIFRSSGDEDSPLTAEQLSRYEAGTFYRTTVNSTVQGKITDKDWGAEKTITFVHQGEVDFIREVKSVAKDHTQVVVGLEILSARDLETKLDLADVNLDLPPTVGMLAKGGLDALRFTGPAGAASGAITQRALEWLKSDGNRSKVLSRINFAVQAATGKTVGEHLLSTQLRPFEAYEGLTADYTYEAGDGLTKFDTQATLTAEQEKRVRDFSVYSEAYLIPDPSEDGPKQWDVNVKNIAHLLAPSQELDVSGSLTIERGDKNGNVVALKIVKGKVVFSGGDDANQVLGTWAARGTLHYDLTNHNILEGKLDGTVSLERRSTDHVLFEQEFTTEPSYQVAMSGFTTKDRAEAHRLVEEVPLTR